MAKDILPIGLRQVRRHLAVAPAKRRRFSSRRTLAHALRACLVTACLCFLYTFAEFASRIPYLVGFAAILLLLARAGRNRRTAGWTHGTARLADHADLLRHRLLGNDGLYLGYATLARGPSLWQALSGLFSRKTASETACRQFFALFKRCRWARRRQIRLNNFVHLATFAPAGRGKSRRVLFQNLRSYPGSCVVNDPKGELFKETAAIRRSELGNAVFSLDPFQLRSPHSDTFNPLLCIDANADDFIEQCSDMANMLVVRTGHEHETHWLDSCEIVLTAFIAYVCACEPDPSKRSFDTVRELLCCRESYATAVAIMKVVESHFPHYAMIRRQGHTIGWYIDKELSSVLTTVQRFTKFLDSPAVARSLGSSSFDPCSLKDKRATLYLILPQDKLETLAPLMRVWLGMILRSITRGVPDESRRVLFLIDEAAHIGNIRVLKNAITLLRGMGIRLWFFYQSLEQLRTSHGDDAGTILDNLETQQFFGINSPAVAEEVSKRIGDATVETVSTNNTTSRSRPVPDYGNQPGNESVSRSVTYAETGRRLFKPEELILVPEDVGLLFHRNVPPVLTHLPDYKDDPAFHDGGTGSQRRLGWPDALLAVTLLTVSSYFAVLTATIPRVGHRPQSRYWQFEPDRSSPHRYRSEPTIYELSPSPSEFQSLDNPPHPPTGATPWKDKSLAGRAAATRSAFSGRSIPPSNRRWAPPGTLRPRTAPLPPPGGRVPTKWEWR